MALIGIFLVGTESKIDDQWERSGTRRYRAAFALTDDENFVRANLGSSFVINFPHPTDAGQVVAEISVTQGEDPTEYFNPTDPADAANGSACFLWDVLITYGPWDPLTHTATGDPADQPPDVSFQWQVFPQICDFAYTPGTTTLVPVVNSSNDPFDPPVEREFEKCIMRVAWNAHTFNPYPFFQFGNYINSDTWNGFPPGSVKFSPPNMPQRLYSQFLGANYYRLEAEFCFTPEPGGWNVRVIDRGYRALDGSGHPFKIVDAVGQPVSQPVLLDGSGNVLTTLSSFVQTEFQVYESTSFASAFPNLTTLF